MEKLIIGNCDIESFEELVQIISANTDKDYSEEDIEELDLHMGRVKEINDGSKIEYRISVAFNKNEF